MIGRGLRILVVEDDPGDAARIVDGLHRPHGIVSIDLIGRGDHVLDDLHQALDASWPLPDLILLDLSLPGADGHEILTAIRGDLALPTWPSWC